MSDRTPDLRQQMCDIGQRIWRRGYCAGNDGNLTIRLDEKRLLCTPTGVSKGFMAPQTMRITDLDGQGLDADGPGVSTEVRMHAAIYRARPDVQAVVHSHAPHATAFALAHRTIDEGVYPEVDVLIGRVPVVPFALPGTADLGTAVADALTPHTWAVLLGNHGAVTFSAKGLEEAYYRMEVLDSTCQILMLTGQIGGAKPLNEDQMRQVLEQKRDFYGLSDERLG
jgi:L-fuculose-phosphate aldolase